MIVTARDMPVAAQSNDSTRAVAAVVPMRPDRSLTEQLVELACAENRGVEAVRIVVCDGLKGQAQGVRSAVAAGDHADLCAARGPQQRADRGSARTRTE